MTLCLDIHTHHSAPQPMAVVSTTVDEFNPVDGQWYSIGYHPWNTMSPLSEVGWEMLEKIAGIPQIKAIGECGIDKLKGAPLFQQLLVMKRQIEISESTKKPLIIHDVKAHDIIVGLKKDLRPTQNWMVHGFRGKPSAAKMLTDAGLFLSFGEKFNSDTLLSVPKDRILAETDESSLNIVEIIAGLSVSIGYDLTDTIAQNTTRFLFGDRCNTEI